MSSILVTGASGQLGKAVVNELLRKSTANQISVLTRNPQKVDGKNVRIIQADYNDYDSLVAAFQGIDKLYFVSSSEIQNRFAQHHHVVNAAIQAKVGHIFYTSAQRKSEDGSSPIASVGDAHWQTDKLIKASGITYTILKHGLYTDILPMFMGEKVIQTGTIFLPAGEGKSSYASRSDLALAGANVLTTQGHENKVYEMGGPVAYSFGQIAAILSELSGKTIQYVSPSIDVFIEQLKGYGLPDEMVHAAGSFCVAIAEGEFNFPASDLEKLLGQRAQTVKEFLKETYQL